MKTIELPTMTDDEIDMLKGLKGQMSDGAGENSDWCNKYWQNIVGFENKDGKSYFSFDESGAFANKTDDKVIKTLGRAFNKICDMLNEIPDCGPELFYDDDLNLYIIYRVDIICILCYILYKQDYTMIDEERRDRLMANARQHLQAAFEAVSAVSDMYWGSNKELVNIYMRIGALHNEVANFGITLD